MSEPVSPSTAELQFDTAPHYGDTKHFTRSMGVVETLSLGFTYLSPLTGLAALLPLGLTMAGPPSIWWLVIVAMGQMLVALVFGEVVSQYPITGGIYPWARRLWGRRYAWVAAWVYLCALVVTITSVAQFGVPFVGALFGFTPTPVQTLVVSVGFLVLALLLNLSGTKTLGRVARLGFYAEIIGVICYGLFLLIFRRHNSFDVFFDSLGAGQGSYFHAFLLASLVGLFMFYGFEACGDVAEEVENPGRAIPRAMILTIVFGLISAVAAFVGFVLAAPDLPSIVSGQISDPMTAILQADLGAVGTAIFWVVALTAFLSCVLSLQAALSRLIFSFARDQMLPASRQLGTLSSNGTPRNAMLVACIAPMLVCVWVFLEPNSLARVTAFAVCGIYLCFQMVVLAALRMRFKGWRPAGPWNLGPAGIVINIGALAYGVCAMIILIWPGDASLSALDRFIVLIGLCVVLGAGAIYMMLARPWGNSAAPAGDAIEVAAQLRAARKQAPRIPASD